MVDFPPATPSPYAVKPTLYLHIGSEKTGTSSLQHFLAINRKQLDRAGLTYFTENKRYYSKHRDSHSPIVASFLHELPDFIYSSEFVPNQYLLSSLKKDLAGEKRNVILSSEHFSSRLKVRQDVNQPRNFLDKRDVIIGKLEQLKDALDSFSVYVVFYTRSQYELYYSLYSTALMHGRREALSDNDVHIYNFFLNHFKLLRPWARVFGRQNVIVRDYNNLVNHDICDDFMSLVGVRSTANFKKVDRINTSLTPKTAETMRRLNLLLPRHDDVGRTANLLLFHFRRFVSFFLERFYRKEQLDDSPLEKKIKSKFERSNRALFNAYPHRIESSIVLPTGR